MESRSKLSGVCVVLIIMSILGSCLTVYYAKNDKSLALPNIKGNTINQQQETDSITGNGSLPDGSSITSTNRRSMPTIGIPNTYIAVLGGFILIFSFSLIYLFESRFGQKRTHDIFINKDKKTIYNLQSLLLSVLLLFATVTSVNKYVFTTNFNSDKNNKISNGNKESLSSSITTNSTLKISESKTLSDKTYDASKKDVSAITIDNGATVILNKLTVTKSAGDSSNIDNSNMHGLNAAIIVKDNSTLTMNDGEITTNAKGANAIFATGNNVKAIVKNVKISTASDSSCPLDVTSGSTIEANNVTMATSGTDAPAIRANNGGGNITVANSDITTNGFSSPIILSSGNVTMTKSKAKAISASLAVIDGNHTITLYDSDLTGYAYGKATTGVDNTGIMLYRSNSSNTSDGYSVFSATDSNLAIDKASISYKIAPMFFVTNAKTIINLTNTVLTFGSNILLNVAGNDNKWGTKGSNGGDATLNATSQTLVGDIKTDNISSTTLNLKESTLKGSINASKTAKSITVSIDNSSKWSVTANSYLTKLELTNNDMKLIDDNGHNIYYVSDSNSWLKNKTYTLQDGGKLLPIE